MGPSAGRGPRLALLAAFAGTSLANYAFSLLMGRLLLPGDFGALAFVQTALLIAGLVLESGVPWSLARALVGVDGPRRGALVRGAARANLALAAGLGALTLALFALGPLRAGLEGWPLALLVAGSLPPIALVGVARGAAQGSERFGALAAVQASEVIGKALAGTLLVLAGLGVAGAVGGFLVGALLAAGLGLAVLSRLGVRPSGPAEGGGLGLLGPMFGGLLGAALLLNLDLLALKLLGGRVASGQYQAGIVLANAPYFLASSVLVPPLFAALARAAQLRAGAALLGAALARTLLWVIPLELLLAAAPGPLLGGLFGPAYLAGAGALALRALGTAALIVGLLLAAAQQATGRARVAALVLLGVSAAEVLALWLAVPRAGQLGAAAVFAGAALASAVGLGLVSWSAVVPAERRRALAWMARYGAALGGGVLVSSVLGKLTASPLFALAGGALVYAGLVLALRLRPGPAAPGPSPLPPTPEMTP